MLCVQNLMCCANSDFSAHLPEWLKEISIIYLLITEFESWIFLCSTSAISAKTTDSILLPFCNTIIKIKLPKTSNGVRKRRFLIDDPKLARICYEIDAPLKKHCDQ